MQVLCHHIYEYKKGLRLLVLHTLQTSLLQTAETKLLQQNINYLIQPVTQSKTNIFFGNRECVEVVRKFGNKKLNELTPEEDFVLGVMLGYDRLQQCQRYLQKKENEQNILRNLFLQFTERSISKTH
ncbi:MAG: DUF2023 family protein [Prevotellaceae bacterium]|nr:DUF2023 family protein [Prevotellaceae bacterium]